MHALIVLLLIIEKIVFKCIAILCAENDILYNTFILSTAFRMQVRLLFLRLFNYLKLVYNIYVTTTALLKM